VGKTLTGQSVQTASDSGPIFDPHLIGQPASIAAALRRQFRMSYSLANSLVIEQTLAASQKKEPQSNPTQRDNSALPTLIGFQISNFRFQIR
jgi:hypothetical protein